MNTTTISYIDGSLLFEVNQPTFPLSRTEMVDGFQKTVIGNFAKLSTVAAAGVLLSFGLADGLNQPAPTERFSLLTDTPKAIGGYEFLDRYVFADAAEIKRLVDQNHSIQFFLSSIPSLVKEIYGNDASLSLSAHRDAEENWSKLVVKIHAANLTLDEKTAKEELFFERLSENHTLLDALDYVVVQQE